MSGGVVSSRSPRCEGRQTGKRLSHTRTHTHKSQRESGRTNRHTVTWIPQFFFLAFFLIAAPHPVPHSHCNSLLACVSSQILCPHTFPLASIAVIAFSPPLSFLSYFLLPSGLFFTWSPGHSTYFVSVHSSNLASIDPDKATHQLRSLSSPPLRSSRPSLWPLRETLQRFAESHV